VTFIISEDEALRNSLTGMTVSDSKSPSRSVGVWFGQPDPEIRTQSFPFITIDLIDVTEARERVMSGVSQPWYFEPEGLEPGDDWQMYYPTPINLDYQITTFARQPRHDRQIMGQLIGYRLPLRFGALDVVERVETDEEGKETVFTTTRRLDVLRVLKRDVTEAGKRMFMNVFTVRVSSEVPQPYNFQTFRKVAEVRLTRHAYDPNAGLQSTPYESEYSDLGAPVGTP
jgi:hypothetical protein